MSETERTCGVSGGVNAAGDRCGVTMGLSEGNGLCSVHDPERADEMQARRANGGRRNALSKRITRAANASAGPRAPKTVKDAAKISAWAIHAVQIGEIDFRVSREIQYGIARFVDAVEKRDLIRQIEEMGRKMKELERAMDGAQKRPRAVS